MRTSTAVKQNEKERYMSLPVTFKSTFSTVCMIWCGFLFYVKIRFSCKCTVRKSFLHNICMESDFSVSTFIVFSWTALVACGLRCFFNVKMLPSCVPRLRLHCLVVWTCEVILQSFSVIVSVNDCEWKMSQKFPRLPSNSVIQTQALQIHV